jgi:hypothetical protein
MNLRSAWLSETGQTREDTRLSPIGAFTPTSPLATRSGVLPGSANGTTRLAGFTLTGATGGMTATVSPGRAVIQGTEGQGAYPVTLTDYATLTFADGNAQFSRVDLVVLRIYDASYDNSARYVPAVEIIQGPAAAGTPVPPAVPPLALPLYEVYVPVGASAGKTGIDWATKVTGRRTATVGVGGILPVTSDTAPGAYPGQYRDSNGHLERWDNGVWSRYPAVPAWQSWTPAWTTTSGLGTPSYGNATVVGRYIQNGPIVHMAMDITFGTTTNFGTGDVGDNWRFALPVPAVATNRTVGFGELAILPGGRVSAVIRTNSTTSVEFIVSSGRADNAALLNNGTVDAVTPWIWGPGSLIRGTATYEAAAA